MYDIAEVVASSPFWQCDVIIRDDAEPHGKIKRILWFRGCEIVSLSLPF